MKTTSQRNSCHTIGSAWISVLLLLLGVCGMSAAPFAEKMEFMQPDGSLIELWGEGDEYHAVFETLDGYTVVFDPNTRSYHYASLNADSSDLVTTGVQVHTSTGAALGLSQHLRIKPEAVRQKASARRKQLDPDDEMGRRWRELKASQPAAEAAAQWFKSGLPLDTPLPDGAWTKDGKAMPKAPPSTTTVGTKVGLCLLIDFDDDPATIARANIVDLCNSTNYTGYGNFGSVRQYFRDVSDGLLTYTNIVTVYIRIPNSLHHKSYYNDTTKDAGAQARIMINDAINIMKALPNYNSEILPTFSALSVDGANQVLACNVFYAGGNGGVWSKGLWPHSWWLSSAKELSAGGKKVYKYQVTNIGSSLRVGTFCHENGHMLCGFPDVYDYGYDSIGGAGNFCLMASGDHLNDKKTPAQVCAYLKRAAGWTVTSELGSSSSLFATLTATSGSRFNHFYRYQKPGTTTEYYMIENRNATGWDAYLPASGIAVWHVDELGNKDDQRTNYNASHYNYEVSLMQADGQCHFQRNLNSGNSTDLFYTNNSSVGYANQFSDSTTPNARWWDGTGSGLVLRNFSAAGTTMSFIIGAGAPISLENAVDTVGSMTWVTGGNGDWFGQTATRHDGVDAARSGEITDSEESWMQTTVVGPGTMTWWWKVISETNFDYLAFYVDGALQSRISGDGGWIRMTNSIAAGSHTLKFRYYKDNSITSGADCGFVDQVDFDGVAPYITYESGSQVVDQGDSLYFYVYASGTPTLTYQWMQNGATLTGQTNYYIYLSNVRQTNSAVYSVRVSNGYGSATSSDMYLAIIEGGTNVTLNVVDTGWYDATGLHNPSQENFFAGQQSSGLRHNNFFVFSRPTLPRPVLSASLRVNAFSVASPQATETYSMYYVSTAVDTLVAGGSGLTSIYSDIGSGTFYGSKVFTNSDAGKIAAIPLNSSFRLYYTNNTTEKFAIGGTISTLDATNSNEYLFGGSSQGNFNTNVQLVLQIEAPVPPFIVTHPVSQFIDVPTNTVTFSVVAGGTPILEYQWMRNGDIIDGATSEDYTIGNLHATNSGRYSVRVTNPFGSVVSSNAFLLVITGETNITLNAFDHGWYRADGYHNPGNANYLVGQAGGTNLTQTYRDFFAFDLPAFPRTIRSAELYVNSYNIEAYSTGGASDWEYLYLYNVTNAVATVLAGGASLTSIYDDLGAGTILGGAYFYTNDARTFNSVPLNSSGLAAINAGAGGQWIVGGRLFSFDTNPLSDEYVFGSSPGTPNFGDVQLRITIDPKWPPYITQDPVSQIVQPGTNVTFSIIATGSPTLRYQWRHEGFPIPNATNPSLSLLNVQSTDAGRYSVVVTNLYGTAVSANARLTILTTEGVVGYYTDGNTGATNPEPSIRKAGFDPVHIVNIGTFDLGTIDMLVLNELGNSVPSAPLAARMPDIRNWVVSGGKLIIHDRGTGITNPTPLLWGAPGTVLVREFSADVDISPPGTSLVTAGPFGTIGFTTLDGGNWSAHGYAQGATLPYGARRILYGSNDTSKVVGFSYRVGNGFTYYSSIPLDYYLGQVSTLGTNFTDIYLPNLLFYMHSQRNVPTVGYFTDNNVWTTSPELPIETAGFNPLQIIDITSFDFSQIDILMLNESDNNDISDDVTNRVADIRSWVQAGGKLVVHDRSAGNVANPSPLMVGAASSVLVRELSADMAATAPANTLVTAGPFGLLDDASLDGGNSSAHGYANTVGLPVGARQILNLGGDSSKNAGLSYPLGQGFVYYSTIPLDYHLDYYGSALHSVAANVYTPNVLAYMNVLGNTPVVGYYTDNNNSLSNAEPPIIRAGYTPLKITNIAGFDFSQISMLMVNESSNGGLSTDLSNRVSDIKSWVLNGGRVVFHDRSAGVPNGGASPFLLGAPASTVYRQTSSDIDVIAPGNTLVTAGPFGFLSNTSLDGGSSSTHGYARSAGLPPGAIGILSTGSDSTKWTALSYPLGLGQVYYGGIPLDVWLTSTNSTWGSNFVNTYTPNVLTYVQTKQAPLPSLVISNLTKVGSTARANFRSVYGSYHFLEYTTAVGSTNWTVVPPTLFGTGEPTNMVDNAATSSERFYRIRLK